MSKYCKNCPLSRPTYDECKYKYIHDLLEHFEKEVEVKEDSYEIELTPEQKEEAKKRLEEWKARRSNKERRAKHEEI